MASTAASPAYAVAATATGTSSRRPGRVAWMIRAAISTTNMVSRAASTPWVTSS